jgi:protein-disulfide isomerase-like protein with CxxC motif
VTSNSFAVTWDYRCPFARNGHEHLVAALEGGASWEVRFVPFSLNQAHVAEGETPVWDDPEKAPALLAMEVGISVRDQLPEAFHKVHLALFRARHEQDRDIREADVLREILTEQGVDADAVLDHVASGAPRKVFREEHEEAVREHGVFGVPTFVVEGEAEAVFVRVMHRPKGDVAEAQRTIERILDWGEGWRDLNEFKRTRIPR